jgi:hypothetical protein
VPALGVKQSKLRCAEIFDVAVTIRDQKCVARFEHTRAIVCECRGSSNVVFVGDADNVRQNEEPS